MARDSLVSKQTKLIRLSSGVRGSADCLPHFPCEAFVELLSLSLLPAPEVAHRSSEALPIPAAASRGTTLPPAGTPRSRGPQSS